MASRNGGSWNPIKILLLVVLVCAVAFGLVVAGGISLWMSLQREQRVQEEPLPQPFPLQGTNWAEAEPASLVAFLENPGTVSPAPRSAAKVGAKADLPIAANNAILARHRGKAEPLPGDDIFKDLVIPRLEITIPPKGVASFRRGGREYATATIREGDTVYTNVGIRLKGGPGSWRPFNEQPAFTVNFDNFVPGQKFHGLKKIHLNNSVQDNSYLEEKISRELFEAAGVPVPRAGHAHVIVNGRNLGMYVLVEGINKQFLKRYFKDEDGNVYEGKSGTDVTSRLIVNSGDDRSDDSGLKALAAAIREPVAGGERLAALEKTLDLDRFLSYVALEMILWHWDGYTMARNNWRVFHDREANRMVFIPQGVDQMFQEEHGPIFPEQPNGSVARAVLQVPELRERYVDKVLYIATNVFVVEAISSRIREVSERVAEVLAEMNSEQAASQHLSRANSLRNRIRQRANFLESQLFPPPAIEFDPSGTVALKDWEPRIDLPEATLTKVQDETGNYLLHILGKSPTTSTNPCTASWRTTRLLDRGRYQLLARIKTKGVILNPKDRRAGAGLRISGHRTGQRNEGDNDWLDISFEFEVAEPQRPTELVCELRANEGEIWYDLKSLKLKRL